MGRGSWLRSVRAWFKYAFAVDKYDESSLSTGEKEILERLAAQIHGRGLSSPAILWLQSNRHMNWFGSQFMVAFQPIFDMAHPLLNSFLRVLGLNVPLEDYPKLQSAFEKRYSVEYLVQRLEALAAGEYNNLSAQPQKEAGGPEIPPKR